MLNEIIAIAEEHEASDPVAIFRFQVKGKEEPLPIPRRCDPDVVAAQFVNKHGLPFKLSATLASKIREKLTECT
jgi:hypothetical protein